MAEEKHSFGDFATVMTQIAEEKGIPKERVVETVEAAVAAAYKKEYGKRGQNIRATFDQVSGNMTFFLVKDVVDETLRTFAPEGEEEDADDIEPAQATDEDGLDKLPRFHPERDITLEDAQKIKKDTTVGDVIETELPSESEFGRVAAQTAKQVVIQRIREAEREAMYQEYKGKEGELINGTVQRIEGRTVFIDLGKSTGVLLPSEQIKGEHYRLGQHIKVYLATVDSDAKGPGIVLSRIHPEMVRRLFELEVPEIFAGTVELKGVAREPGLRSKISVYTEEEGVDPIGSCVGQKGTRVQAVIDELGGEKIDIIEWNADSAEYIAAALAPAQVQSVTTDDEQKKATVVVPHDQLSLAIGKKGQNVRLAVKLTGWDIDVVADETNGGDAVASDTSAEESVKSKETTEGASDDVAVEEPQKDVDAVTDAPAEGADTEEPQKA